MKLLNIDANPKTIKGQSRGYMTAILYLAPWRSAGVNVCPTAEIAGCAATCLNTAGRGGMATGRATFSPYGVTLPDNVIQRARIARTYLFHKERPYFMQCLLDELRLFVKRAERQGLVPCVRLNGTSDLLWERYGLDGKTIRPYGLTYTIFDRFPRVQFYDYTKLPARLGHPDHARTLPVNYHLSISWSGANVEYQALAERWSRNTGAPLVVVVAPDSYDHTAGSATRLGRIAERAGCTHMVNGDTHDLRFLDPPHSLVVLRAKGRARRETNGFILRGE